ncbi:class I SAM-dependent methyltransferase [Planomicrobium chinense]|uniref:class I SAM-dependent methyltransferase n=1 Tax=Planococcus chinensis TaxID=272917 RepID=UPI001CC3CDA1|nr:class I SAM-dependent methyltransferase [Planococcus chinensis]MBZ5202622.1 class I SAM-dependent methyltransferase [Planococcus chinensis]
MKTIVTTAYRPNGKTDRLAAQAATDLSIPFVLRKKRSIEKIHAEECADVLVAAKGRLEFYPLGKTEPFFFHPNSAAFRTKRPIEEDPLIAVSNLEAGEVFFDCTLGMASDAIVAAYRVGSKGEVIGCESHPVLAYVIEQGLGQYDAMPHLDEAMKRIRVVSKNAVDVLKSLPDNAVDVVYMDPMFTEEITEASNFTPLRGTANNSQLTGEWVKEAVRAARKSVVLKAHFRSVDFEKYGFVRRVRPNTKFHYGFIDCRQQ